MDAVSALTRLGGIGSTADLLELTTRKRLRRAVADRTIVHVSRGRYALPSADLARSLAAEIDGHLRLLSAVAHWGWESKWPAHHPQLGVARRPARPVEAEVFVGDVPRRDVDGWATSKVRTVLDCAAELPFDEALAVADSALRHEDVTRDELEAAMGDDPRVRRVVAHATHLAANPFESVLRAILVEAGIGLVPQWETTIGRVTYDPDLAEPFAGLAIEANSWRFHAGKGEHDDDCRRYNALIVGGWTVLRFTWEQVMFSPWEVVAAVRGVLALPCRGLGATVAA